VVLPGPAATERDLLLAYLKGKTLGYVVRRRGGSEIGELRRAFVG
jgi:hypothetical protein